MSEGFMPYRLIALDLDGTLLDEGLSISPRVSRALERVVASGARLTLASGRGYPSMRRWVDDLGITTPVICYQGAVVTDTATHRGVYQRTIRHDLVGDVVAFARARALSLTLYVGDEIYVENKRHSDAFYEKWFGLPFHVVEDLNRALPGEPVKFLIVGDEEELDALHPAVTSVLADRLQIVRSHRYFLEGLAGGASKGQALAWLAGELGIPRGDTMAIGDSGNDRAMIAWAGLGVAMGNASDEAKAVADWIAPGIDEDGVAEAIERFCLDGTHG
jgi:Cof subfamily protein (haloacid dehalogenase superfamily)